jgi:hypothetical protein
MKPAGHPTRWTLVFEDGLCLYESRYDAEMELRRAQARGATRRPRLTLHTPATEAVSGWLCSCL